VRIALINNFFPPRVGGSALFVASLAEALAEKGHQVLVITGTYQQAEIHSQNSSYRVEKIKSWTLPKTSFSFNFDINFCLLPGNSARVRKTLDEFDPDVVHCHGQFLDLTWKALKWAHLHKKKTALTLHTRLYNPKSLPNTLMKILDYVVVRPRMKRYKPTKYIVIDKHFATYAKQRYAANEGDLISIPIGVDTKSFVPDTTTAFSERRTIASIGHVIPIRNRVTLVRAFKRYLEVFPNTTLVIVGNVYEKSLYQEIFAQNLGDHTLLTGALPRIQIIEILKSAIMEIHDVQEHEGRGLGIASLEAMLMGVPIISSTPVDYFPNAVLTPDHDLLIVQGDNESDLLEQMIKLTRNEALWHELSKNGRKWVLDHFSLDRVVVEHQELYASLVSTK